MTEFGDGLSQRVQHYKWLDWSTKAALKFVRARTPPSEEGRPQRLSFPTLAESLLQFGAPSSASRVAQCALWNDKRGTMSAPVPYAASQNHVRLSVRVVARAKRTELVGVAKDSAGRPTLNLRLAAPPIEGAANTALIEYVAKALKLRQRDVSIELGQQSRNKLLHLAGDCDAIVARLQTWIGSIE